ncbi:MAG: glycosyltransferase family A protein [Desulfobacterales bacterium]
MDVDVVIPVFNGAEFVAEAIDSVLAQTVSPHKILVVDDCSTDGTPAVLQRFGDRIKVIRHDKNRGLPASRNTGIRETESELIAFLDADDAWLPLKLEKQLAEFRENPEVGLCYTDIIECDFKLSPRNDGRKFRRRKAEHVFEELYLSAFPIPPSTVMVRREVFDVCGMFDETMLKAQDYECWLRIAMKYAISCIDQPLCFRRDNPASITNMAGMEKHMYYSFRAFELCEKAAKENKIRLPMTVTERKRLFLYRSCCEAIKWGQAKNAAFFLQKIEDMGGLGIGRKLSLLTLKWLQGMKAKARSAFLSRNKSR